MKTGRKTWVICFFLVILTVLAGKMGFDYAVGRKAAQIAEEQQARADRKRDVLEYLSSEHSSGDIEKELLSAFEILDEEDRTEIVDTYLYGTYHAAMQYELSNEQTDHLLQYVNEEGLLDISMISDIKLKEQIHSLADQHIVLRYLNGALYWDVDYGYFDQTFSAYLRPDYRDIIAFYAKEREESYYDEQTMSLNTDVVISRLERAYRMISTYPDSDLLYFMEDSYYLYKAVYLGAYAQDYIFENGLIRKEVFESYCDYSETCSDKELGEFLTGLIREYQEVDGTRTVPIYESIKEFCGFYEETP